jgi:hypothetical protein
MGTLARGLSGHPARTQMVLPWDPVSVGPAPVTAQPHSVVAGSVRAPAWRSPTAPGGSLRKCSYTVMFEL